MRKTVKKKAPKKPEKKDVGKKVPARKPKREKKPSPYTFCALVWWQENATTRWKLDASLTTKSHLADGLAELLEQRAKARTKGNEAIFRRGVMDATSLCTALASCEANTLLPCFGELALSPDVGEFIKETVYLLAWIHEAQRNPKAPLHFVTWMEKGMPIRPKRIRKKKEAQP